MRGIDHRETTAFPLNLLCDRVEAQISTHVPMIIYIVDQVNVTCTRLVQKTVDELDQQKLHIALLQILSMVAPSRTDIS